MPDQWRGRALGWYQAVIGIRLLPANLMFGVLYQYFGASDAFTMGAILALLAVGLLPREQRRPNR